MPYCTVEEVNSLFGDVSDDIPSDMFTTVITNATSWIDSNLKKNNVPVPVVTVEEIIETITDDPVDVDESSEETTETETPTDTTSSGGVNQTTNTVSYNLINVPSGLRTASIYHAASDILLSLYHGDELPIQYDVWFNKAQTLLQDYIDAYWNDEANPEDASQHRIVGHSHGLTYNQKRHRPTWRY